MFFLLSDFYFWHHIYFVGSWDVYEKLWQKISQWSGQVPVSQRTHQSSFSKGKSLSAHQIVFFFLYMLVMCKWHACHTHTPVHSVPGLAVTRTCKEEGAGVDLQLDSGVTWWGQDLRCLPDAEETRWDALCLLDKWRIYLLKLFEGSRDFNPCYNKARKNYKNNEWTLGLSLQSGIIKQDPELPPDKLLNLPPPRPKNAIFEDEEKSKVRTV